MYKCFAALEIVNFSSISDKSYMFMNLLVLASYVNLNGFEIQYCKRIKPIPPSYPTCFPYPYLWNLGVGEAGPKNVGEAENLCFLSITMNLSSTN